MILEKRIVEETSIDWEVKQKEVFIETKTEVKEIVWHKDFIESQIAQKKNLIDNAQAEIVELQEKLWQITSLEAKSK